MRNHPSTQTYSAEYYQATRQSYLDEYVASSAPTRAVHRLIRKLTALTDAVVQARWRSSVMQVLPPELLPHVSLAAVGGYGRGELLPNSDVDVLVLIDDK